MTAGTPYTSRTEEALAEPAIPLHDRVRTRPSRGGTRFLFPPSPRPAAPEPRGPFGRRKSKLIGNDPRVCRSRILPLINYLLLNGEKKPVRKSLRNIDNTRNSKLLRGLKLSFNETQRFTRPSASQQRKRPAEKCRKRTKAFLTDNVRACHAARRG